MREDRQLTVGSSPRAAHRGQLTADSQLGTAHGGQLTVDSSAHCGLRTGDSALRDSALRTAQWTAHCGQLTVGTLTGLSRFSVMLRQTEYT